MAMYIVAQKVYRLIISGSLMCDTRCYELASFSRLHTSQESISLYLVILVPCVHFERINAPFY
jgi:hypothetical protein